MIGRFIALGLVTFAFACNTQPSLTIIVTDHGEPVPGVQLDLRRQDNGPVLASQITDVNGTAVFKRYAASGVDFEAMKTDADGVFYVHRRLADCRRHEVVRLDLDRDFERGPLVLAEEGAAAHEGCFDYVLPPCASDRQVQAVLEIDRLEGVEAPTLSVSLPTGELSLAEILAAVGLDLRVVWSDLAPHDQNAVRSAALKSEERVRSETCRRQSPVLDELRQHHSDVEEVPGPTQPNRMSVMSDPAPSADFEG